MPPPLCTDAGVPAGCVQCLTGADCPAATPACYPATHTCRAACNADGGPACVGMTPICDTTSSACVGCRVGGTDCPAARRVCNPATQLCVVCTADRDCAGTAMPRCDTATNACVACVANSDCTTAAAGPFCRRAGVAAGTCGPGCTSNATCTDAGAMVCDMTNGACVQCMLNSDCSGTTPVCDQANAGINAHRCVACLPAPIGSDAGPMGCDAGQRCVGGGGMPMCM
jgi:hypothetical protein